MTFAHFPGEDPEQTAAHIAALHVELEGRRSRGDDEKDVLAELERLGEKPAAAKQRLGEKPAAAKRTAAKGETRLRGQGAEKRA